MRLIKITMCFVLAFLFYALGYSQAITRVEEFVGDYWVTKWEGEI